MIDDIWFSGLAPEDVGDEPPGFVPGVALAGRPRRLISRRAHGAILIEYTPTTRLVTVRVSVPKWLSSLGLCNYPLVPIRGVEDLRVRAIQSELARAFGLRLSAIGTDFDDNFPIRRWVVTRVSFAVDIPVTDPCGVITACESLQRRWPGTPKRFGQPTETLMWGEKTKRPFHSVSFYAKGIELRSQARRLRDQGDRAAVRGLAERAQGIVRFEVGFHRVRPIREWLGLKETGQLMTLAFVCDPLVGRWALTREAWRLRLDEQYTTDDAGPLSVQVRHVVGVLTEHRRRLEANRSERVGRRATITADRMEQLMVSYFLLSGYTPGEAATILERSASALRDLQRDLAEMGLHPDRNLGGLGAAVGQIQGGLAPVLLADIPPDFTSWKSRRGEAYADPPWAEGQAPEEDEDEDEDYEVDPLFVDPPGVVSGSIGELYDALVA
jgi:hypothetical protein